MLRTSSSVTEYLSAKLRSTPDSAMNFKLELSQDNN